MRAVWTRPAARDLESIGDYISHENPHAAERVVNRIRDAAGNLADFAGLGRQGRVTNTRELIVSSTPFIIVYRVGENQVEILAVFHSARRWPESFDVPQ